MKHRFSKETYSYFHELAESLIGNHTRCIEIENEMQKVLNEEFPIKKKSKRYRSASTLLYIFMCRYSQEMPFEHIGLSLVPPVKATTVNHYCNWVETYFLERR